MNEGLASIITYYKKRFTQKSLSECKFLGLQSFSFLWFSLSLYLSISLPLVLKTIKLFILISRVVDWVELSGVIIFSFPFLNCVCSAWERLRNENEKQTIKNKNRKIKTLILLDSTDFILFYFNYLLILLFLKIKWYLWLYLYPTRIQFTRQCV